VDASDLMSVQGGIEKSHRRVILASSLGTVFEWYDFYLYGSLAAIISKQFFSGVNETTGFIFALLAFAAGFAVRPFGALVFGRFGDLVGRKHTFLITIVIMGLSTALVGVLPGYAQIGVSAPIILVALRMLQGLALGGEYGGAATYVGEHAPGSCRSSSPGLMSLRDYATRRLCVSRCLKVLCGEVFVHHARQSRCRAELHFAGRSGRRGFADQRALDSPTQLSRMGAESP
jgi:hypothetical protein